MSYRRHRKKRKGFSGFIVDSLSFASGVIISVILISIGIYIFVTKQGNFFGVILALFGLISYGYFRHVKGNRFNDKYEYRDSTIKIMR